MIQESERTERPLGGAPLIQLDADLTEDGRYGHRRLNVTSEHVFVTEEDGTVVLRVPIADLATARTEPLVSGGRLLLLTKKAEEIVACSYSLTHAEQFSEAARGIEQLAQGKELSIRLEFERTRCEKCGRLLPEKDGVCPSCVNRGKTLLRIAGYLGPYKKQAAILALCAFASTTLNLIPPVIQKNLIDGLVGNTLQYNHVLVWLAGWLGVILGVVGLQITNGRLMAYLATHVSADLRSSVYRAIEFLQLTYFDKKPVGAIASRVTQDTDRIWQFLVDGLPFFLTNGLMLIGVAGFLFWVNPILALAILAPLPMVAVTSMIVWKPISNMFHRVSQKMARLHMHLNESLMGIRVVKAFVREDQEYAKFLRRNHEWQDIAMRADQRWYTAFGAMSLFTSMGVLINWTVGGWFVINKQMTLGEFIMVNSLLVMVYGPLQWFAQINNWFSRAMAGAERVFEVLNMKPEVRESRLPTHAIQGRVDFDGVRFGYDKSNPVLKGVTFHADAGEMIGLVGPSGAGKSTTINLICRFYEPDAGAIRVDGEDYRDFDLHDYRSQIGIVLQEPFLFNGTIADNIAYGKPGASLDEVMVAAKAANAHDFILSKTDGYDTVVGERGARLSGGEKQRISIARAILHNPRILILDEATSSVDVETEKQIQEAIQRLVSGRTTFAIAHRLSTLRYADRLVVLERGEIAEMGTHEELMARQGVFYKLVQTQSKVHEIVGLAYGDHPPTHGTEEA